MHLNTCKYIETKVEKRNGKHSFQIQILSLPCMFLKIKVFSFQILMFLEDKHTSPTDLFVISPNLNIFENECSYKMNICSLQICMLFLLIWLFLENKSTLHPNVNVLRKGKYILWTNLSKWKMACKCITNHWKCMKNACTNACKSTPKTLTIWCDSSLNLSPCIFLINIFLQFSGLLHLLCA